MGVPPPEPYASTPATAVAAGSAFCGFALAEVVAVLVEVRVETGVGVLVAFGLVGAVFVLLGFFAGAEATGAGGCAVVVAVVVAAVVVVVSVDVAVVVDVVLPVSAELSFEICRSSGAACSLAV